MTTSAQAWDAQTAVQPTYSFASPSAMSDPTFWKFDQIDYFYKTENDSVRVGVRCHGSAFLFNPEGGVLERFHTDGLEKWLYRSILGMEPMTLRDGTFLRGNFSTDCGGRDFADPFLAQVIEGGRKVGGFYILARRQPPEGVYRELPGGQYCADTDHQERMYREIGRPIFPAGTAISLPDDSVLFFNLYDGYMVKLKHMPRTAMSLGGNVFFVPEAGVHDELAKAGPDLHRRYAVFLKAIAAARLFQPTALKETSR